MERDLVVNSHVTIPWSELRFRFSRSGGPGGQNVNKLATRVELLFDVLSSPSLTEEQKKRIADHLASAMNADGVLRVVVSETRSQLQNREMAAVRLREMLRRGLRVRRRRKPTRPPPAATMVRLEEKRHRGELKRVRRNAADQAD